jgi:hypothetical protein
MLAEHKLEGDADLLTFVIPNGVRKLQNQQFIFFVSLEMSINQRRLNGINGTDPPPVANLHIDS